MARNAPAEISEETSPGDVDVIALPQTGWPGFKEKFLACFWELEEHLADLFGLNDSKYQWAVDQYMDERDAQKDQEDFAAFEQEQEMEMETEMALYRHHRHHRHHRHWQHIPQAKDMCKLYCHRNRRHCSSKFLVCRRRS